jgi:enoyl-[acyl-carrier protein] reductase II
MNSTAITKLFRITYPIIQAGMIWVSGSNLAAAVSNAGGLGIIGAGSMDPELLREHIQKTKQRSTKPFGVNLPLIYKHIEACIRVVLDEQVPILFTSAGSPKKYTPQFKEAGAIVCHVVSTPELAQKCEQAGVDAVVAEGFEAGGHNGRDELTTLTLIPQVRQAVTIPVIAAGGIITGAQMAAALLLGADGVQMGTRFAATEESSAHPRFKEQICSKQSADTFLALRKLIPVRLIKNTIALEFIHAEAAGATPDELLALLGEGRAKQGMFDGDIEQGELEVSQGIGLIREIKPAETVLQDILQEYTKALQKTLYHPT